MSEFKLKDMVNSFHINKVSNLYYSRYGSGEILPLTEGFREIADDTTYCPNSVRNLYYDYEESTDLIYMVENPPSFLDYVYSNNINSNTKIKNLYYSQRDTAFPFSAVATVSSR